MWGTVWDEKNGNKYSISHHSLYPESAVLIPELTLTMPRALTVSTGLDALSHAMESLWNKSNNVISSAFATNAIKLVRTNLPLLLADPSNMQVYPFLSCRHIRLLHF
eukprot:GILJ01010682.1.p2 GENE.GILJ01010682.1~~GILJ01010682.1.p2  ORF type:complete len:107 (-),score=9.34 GILJ01010682.1:739-1059(-)